MTSSSLHVGTKTKALHLNFLNSFLFYSTELFAMEIVINRRKNDFLFLLHLAIV